MPLFDMEPEEKLSTEDELKATQHAKTLYDALSTCIGMTPKRGAWKRWADDFRLLMLKDGIESDRITKVLKWLCQPEQIRKTKARSGKGFRAMFETLEAFAADHVDLETRELSKQESSLLRSLKRRLPGTTEDDITQAILLAADRLQSMSHGCRQEWNAKALRSFSTLETILLAMIQRLQNWSKWDGSLAAAVKRLPTSPELREWCEHRDLKIEQLVKATTQ